MIKGKKEKAMSKIRVSKQVITAVSLCLGLDLALLSCGSASFTHSDYFSTECFVEYFEAGGDFPGFAKGTGAENDPYLVCSSGGLDEMRNTPDAHFILGYHIDVSSIRFAGSGGWNPVGDSANPFTGNFNGNGYSISNMRIYRNDLTIGFFGVIAENASIHNVNLVNLHIQGGASRNLIGGLVGYQNGGMIMNSYVTGTVDGGNNDDFVGGLVGRQTSGTIENSYAAVTVDGGGNNDSVGGLVGIQDVGGTIENSYATDTVDGGNGRDFVGGLVGEQDGTIENSYAVGAVDGGGNNDSVGGLVGYQNGGMIVNSYAAGAVTNMGGTGNLGGFVGEKVDSATINGTNYFVDSDGGANGIGNGTCTPTAVCRQAMDLQEIFDSLFRRASTTPPLGMGWSTTDWRNRNNAHPCIAGIDFGPRGGCPP